MRRSLSELRAETLESLATVEPDRLKYLQGQIAALEGIANYLEESND